MGVVVGVLMLLVCGWLLAAALQKTALIKPYLGLFAVAGLACVVALVLGQQPGGTGERLMLAAKALALLGCLVLCVHLAVLVARRLMGNRHTRS